MAYQYLNIMQVFAWKHRKYLQRTWKRHVLYFTFVILGIAFISWSIKSALEVMEEAKRNPKKEPNAEFTDPQNEIENFDTDLRTLTCKRN